MFRWIRRVIIFQIFVVILVKGRIHLDDDLHQIENEGDRYEHSDLAGDLVDKAAQSIDIIADTAEKVNVAVAALSVLDAFNSMSKSLSVLGPVFMAISAVLSIISLFLPQAESPEMKALNAGFEKINTRLEGVKSSLNELKIVIELSNAKQSLLSSFDTVDTLDAELLIAKKRASKIAWKYFQEVFEREYNYAADSLFNAMIGNEVDQDFRFDLLDLFKSKFLCSSKSLSRICLMTMHTINRALAIESAYLASINYPTRVKILRVQWQKRLNRLRERCGIILSECTDKTDQYVETAFLDYYNQKVFETGNHAFVTGAFSLLSETASEYIWFIFASHGAEIGPFKYEHHLQYPTKFTRINTNKKNVIAVYFTNKEPHYNIKEMEPTIKFIISKYESMQSCAWNNKGELWYGTASIIRDAIVRAFPKSSVISSVQGIDPKMSGTKDRYMEFNVAATYCIQEALKIFVMV